MHYRLKSTSPMITTIITRAIWTDCNVRGSAAELFAGNLNYRFVLFAIPAQRDFCSNDFSCDESTKQYNDWYVLSTWNIRNSTKLTS